MITLKDIFIPQPNQRAWHGLRVPRHIERAYLEGLHDPLPQAFVHGTVLARLMGLQLDGTPCFPALSAEEAALDLDHIRWMIDRRFPLVTVTNQASAFTGDPQQINTFNRSVLGFLVDHFDADTPQWCLKELTLAYGHAGYFNPKDPSVPVSCRYTSIHLSSLQSVISKHCGPVAAALIELGADTSQLPVLTIPRHGRPDIQAGDFTAYLDDLQRRDPRTWRHVNEALMRRSIAANATVSAANEQVDSADSAAPRRRNSL